MNKAYSNKALPMGTVLREWRIEEVLGVGGFGIVYKARGHLFQRTRCDKGIFPELDQRAGLLEDTVVPIDSEAEEVHALGLKKFVEEAKLLWNLSTPTRHPNIVSVRSLFEIHGTAYMVMDFEDGLSLSRMLKQGSRFNERSLWSILQPDRRGAGARSPGRRAPPGHQAAQHPHQRGQSAGADRLRVGTVRSRRSDQHESDVPHPALRGDRTICENLSRRVPGRTSMHWAW